jgi:hypothetical protein
MQDAGCGGQGQDKLMITLCTLYRSRSWREVATVVLPPCIPHPASCILAHA